MHYYKEFANYKNTVVERKLEYLILKEYFGKQS